MRSWRSATPTGTRSPAISKASHAPQTRDLTEIEIDGIGTLANPAV